MQAEHEFSCAALSLKTNRWAFGPFDRDTQREAGSFTTLDTRLRRNLDRQFFFGSLWCWCQRL
ncbi:MAG TPA: hypothetical protein PLF81_30950, partial [Candidatus Anammoximicrobium sp.]|nr:hypothetical protein [Candidatus Anammoximicrobium sp.]